MSTIDFSYLIRKPVPMVRSVENYRPKPGKRMALVASFEKRGYEEVDGPDPKRVYLQPTRDLSYYDKLAAFAAAYALIDINGVSA